MGRWWGVAVVLAGCAAPDAPNNPSAVGPNEANPVLDPSEVACDPSAPAPPSVSPRIDLTPGRWSLPAHALTWSLVLDLRDDPLAVDHGVQSSQPSGSGASARTTVSIDPEVSLSLCADVALQWPAESGELGAIDQVLTPRTDCGAVSLATDVGLHTAVDAAIAGVPVVVDVASSVRSFRASAAIAADFWSAASAAEVDLDGLPSQADDLSIQRALGGTATLSPSSSARFTPTAWVGFAPAFRDGTIETRFGGWTYASGPDDWSQTLLPPLAPDAGHGPLRIDHTLPLEMTIEVSNQVDLDLHLTVAAAGHTADLTTGFVDASFRTFPRHTERVRHEGLALTSELDIPRFALGRSTPPAVHFPCTPPGTTHRYALSITNPGDLPLEVEPSWDGDGGVFHTDPEPLVVAPGAEVGILITATPPHSRAYTADLVLVTSDPFAPIVRIPVSMDACCR